ncbi:MAG: response regulator [Acidobacteria bacterium]|nr:response regulator [Acidobacteriota bacterium]
MTSQVVNNRAGPKLQGPTGKKILVVEDEQRDLEQLSRVLREHGFDVNACESLTQGATLVENGNYDFILVEQGSHAFEGRAVLERVLAVDRRLPTVVLTRCLDMDCYLEAMQMGAIDYIEKPMSDDDILRVVQTHLRPPSLAA